MLSERDVVSRGLTHNISEGKQALPQGQDQRPLVLSSSEDCLSFVHILGTSEAKLKGD